MYVLAGKPNSSHDSAEGVEDGECIQTSDGSMIIQCHVHATEEFLNVYKRAQEIPQKKYQLPQTEAQEIGWDTNPLVRILHHIIVQR